LLLEQPNGDFGQTMMRQYLFDQFHLAQLHGLKQSRDERIAGIAAKAVKEVTYHVERSAQTIVALGDGTEESNRRMQAALNLLWPYVGEMFVADAVDLAMANAGVIPDPSTLRVGYDIETKSVFDEAMLVIPADNFAHSGGKTGYRHTEHLGHLLSSMQWLQRAYPQSQW
jgi:ring-1,2-phenylacetyl-CoA epoxidase subunit PaaC